MNPKHHHAILVSKTSDFRGPMTRIRMLPNFVGHSLRSCPHEPVSKQGEDLERHYDEHHRLAMWSLTKIGFGRKLVRLIGRAEAEQVARCALLHAMRRYRPDKGAKFSTYAVWWFRAYFSRAMREELRQRQPLGIRFDAPLNANEARTLLHACGMPEKRDEEIMEAARFVQTWLLTKGRNGQITLEYLTTGATLEQIAERYGVTRERVRQIKDKYTAKARQFLTPEGALRHNTYGRE